MRSLPALTLAALTAAAAGRAHAQAFNGGLPAGFTCNAASPAFACGTSTASGTLTLAPGGGSRFGWISTSGGNSRNPLGITGTTNGTTLTSNVFSVTAGQSLGFSFNYITSDGSGSFTDYAYVRLLRVGGSASILFTARTNPTPGANTVPGFGLPGIAPGVTLTPPSTPINPGAVTFAPGNISGCFATGCGFTGWITAQLAVADAGDYQLEFNVFNVGDTNFQTGLAFDYTLVGGVPAPPPTDVIPEPSTYALMATGLAGLAALRRRRRNA